MRLMSACIAVLLLFAGPLRADEPDLFAAVQARLATAAVVRGQFVQTRTLQGIARPLQSSGRFVVDAQRGVLWITEKPFPNTLRVTGDEIVQLDGSEVLMRLRAEQEPTVRSVGRVLRALFGGDLAGLRAGFEASGALQPDGWQLRLVPRDAGLARAIRALSLRGAGTVQAVELVAASGDVTRIAYAEVQHDTTLTEAERAAFD